MIKTRTRSMKAVAVVAIGFLIAGVSATAASAVQPDFICSDLSSGKIDTTGDPATVEYTAPTGFVVDYYCVKAGTTSVIVQVDPPSATVTIDHPDKDSVSHYSVHYIPVETPDVNYCNPAERPAGMSIAQWLREGEFNGADCFTITPNLQCGSFDSTVSGPLAGYTWRYLEGAGMAPNLSTGMALPATFGEDYNGGSVQITVWLEGPEKDYLVGTGLPNYWDGNGRTVTINTDCAPPVPVEVTAAAPTVAPLCGPNNDTVTIPEVEGVIYADGGWVDGERTITATADEGYDLVVGADAEWTFTDVPVAACPDEGPAFSYTPTEELAYTGWSTTTGGLAALAILLLASGAALVSRKGRA